MGRRATGAFTLGSVNKGDERNYRELRDKDILSSPAVVLLVQDTAPFDDNVFVSLAFAALGGSAMVVMLMFLHDVRGVHGHAWCAWRYAWQLVMELY